MDNIIHHYDLNTKIHNNYAYYTTIKGIYGLKQASLLKYNDFKKYLSHYGYYPIPHTVGLWKYTTRQMTFCLCVDNFGVKYFHKQDIDHLISTLTCCYKISLDWSGKNYYELTLDWCYNLNYLDIGIPSNIPSIHTRFHHKKPSPPVLAPIPLQNNPSLLPTSQKPLVLQIIGCLFYYIRSIDSSLLVALNIAAQSQAALTTHTLLLCCT